MSDIKIKTNKYISNIIIIIVAYGIDYHYSLTGGGGGGRLTRPPLYFGTLN